MADNTKEQDKLINDRKEWEKNYAYWLTRKNNFAAKLQAAGRTTEGSAKYKELDTEVKKYFQLLRDSLPAYRAMFNQVGK